MVLAGGLAIFGLSQLLGTSGLLVTYLAAATPGASEWISRVSSPATNRSGRTLKAPVLVLAGGLAIFGLSQLLGTSGLLVTYLAAATPGASE
jgi:NhaP-type Na+/H+ and K+/H+ antiporter